MKLKYISSIALALTLGFGLTSCEDFLDRPTEDNYSQDNYYQTDDQCLAGTAYLYNSPWYDFQRGFIDVGEVLSGNCYKTGKYLTFTVNGTDDNLINMAYSLWAENAHCNAVYDNIKKAPASVSDNVRKACMGECLTWKAMAYFFLVRSFGEIPIVHNNTASLNQGDYNTYQKAQRDDVYEYICMTLEEAIKLLPEDNGQGRLNKWSAKALLAKVYLTRAGVKGELDAAHLKKAADTAKEVMDGLHNKGVDLLDNYQDVFLLKNRYNKECLISWRWTAEGEQWTRQNSLQSDFGLNGIDEQGATWGDWNGVSVDLQLAFGVDLLGSPSQWLDNPDTRLKATMMLPGFKYDHLWQDKGGFDYLKAMHDGSLANTGLSSSTGANFCKHIYGDGYDHLQGAGCSDGRMANSLPTHLLRLSDVYLIYAEAKMLEANPGAGVNATSADPSVIDAFYQVRHRAVKSYVKPNSVSFMDIWKERRLELALEGDRWYDFVRVSYYDPNFTINELNNQHRNNYWGLQDVYKHYYETGEWVINEGSAGYDESATAPNVRAMMKKDDGGTKEYFFIPFPTEDVVFNRNLGSDVNGVHVDVHSEKYSY